MKFCLVAVNPSPRLSYNNFKEAIMQNIVIDNLLMMELIKALGNILTAAVPSIAAYYIGKKVVNEQKLQSKLDVALGDIAFLLAVEDFHCREHLVTQGRSNKRNIRDCVKQETALVWSGRNTLSRIDKAKVVKHDSVIVQTNKLVSPSRMKSRY